MDGGHALIFINYTQAATLGHVAWGFSVDERNKEYCFGSTDHLLKDPWWDLAGWLRYAHVNSFGHNDWWSERGDVFNMLRTMRQGHHIRYHALKSLELNEAFPKDAVIESERKRHAGWSVFKNNCVHQTYDVLKNYGAQLPDPLANPAFLIPKAWFNAINGETFYLNGLSDGDIPWRGRPTT